MNAEKNDEPALRGAVTNDLGELSRLLEWLLGTGSTDSRNPMSGVRALTLVGGLTEDSSVEGVLGFRCTDASWARAHAAELITALRPHYGLWGVLKCVCLAPLLRSPVPLPPAAGNGMRNRSPVSLKSAIATVQSAS